jgi:hypothetical protein
MLGKPTTLALGLAETPQFYIMKESVRSDRKLFIESFYQALNEAGNSMDATRQMQLVQEAIIAYRHNAMIVRERPYLYLGAAKGVAMLASGILRDKLFGSKS